MTDRTYKNAGVDLDASQALKQRIKDIAIPTYGPEVLSGVGGFGAIYQIARYTEPILVSSTDPVGTKLKLAIMMDRYNTIGVDLVNACVNDVIVCGAKPIFFLDYINMGRLIPNVIEEIVKGIAKACLNVNCAIIGGETAEMPGVFAGDNFDISGFIVGVVEKTEMIDSSNVCAGDILIGIPSNGLHTNGYSLVRHVYDLESDPSPLREVRPDLGETLGEALLKPHPSYFASLSPVFSLVNGMAHITGGGLLENVPRMLPKNLSARFDTQTWPIPPIFTTIEKDADIPKEEMYRVFNMGLGMVIACDPSKVETVTSLVPNSLVVGDVRDNAGQERVILQY